MSKRFARRKWGWYLTLLDREHFKVKLLRFNMKDSLSRQYHKRRSELWLFLSGEGAFELGELVGSIGSGGYKRVPKAESHRFTPWAKTFVLEIQYGECCDERDIVRL